eukprot:TCONS_00071996-protein
MGKKAKIGKKRKDKFYHLAKETGYRARSAFKLIQLNRKFGFLQESRALIDLCAAPGGWLQVASNFMPMSSVILGVDLVPIKAIKNVTTFASDITTDNCRQLLKKELKGWKADVVLNDGAPNVGSAWIQDAFTQSQLALSALKLASEFLRKGGWFITKIFRSKDYTALLWVFQQLFKKVHSTKPQASRSESAEIFVVCQGFLAPDKLDEKFLDPRHVFKEIQDSSKVKLDVLRPEKHVRHREGYDENNTTMFEKITAMDFFKSPNAIDVLSTVNKIEVINEEIKNHAETNEEILHCCEDIKVLGRKELKNLFTWRKKLRKALELHKDEEEAEDKSKEEVQEEPMNEEEQLDEMVSNLKDEEEKDLKKKKKKVREQKKKLRERLAGKLADAMGETENQDQEMFALNQINSKKELDDEYEGDDQSLYDEDSEGEELQFESDQEEGGNDDSEADSSDEEYAYGDDELYEKSAKKRRMEQDDQQKKQKSLQKSKLKKLQRKSENPLLVNMNEDISEEANKITKAKQWFQKDIFKGAEGRDKGDSGAESEEEDEDEDYDIEAVLKAHKKKGGKVVESVKTSKESSKKENGKTHQDEEDRNEEDTSDESSSDEDDGDIDDRSIVQGKEQDKQDRQKKKDGFEIAPVNHGTLGPEALAIGAAIATSRKRKRDIVDDSFNRYSYNDNGLPSWFTEDEAKHTLRHVPVTKEEVAYYKQRMMEINARPIKKVVEAKTKRKYKTMKKLERARKRAQGILDATDVSSQEKTQQIKGIYKKAGLLSKKKAETTYVVAKKGLAGKKYKRPNNVKGPYKVVDPRMKKDLKAAASKEKTKGRGRKKGKKR